VSPLLSPLKYLSIRHGWWLRYNVVCPTIGAVLVATVVYATPGVNPVFGKEGFLKGLEPTLAIVGGFFIAALTLVTTDKSEILKAPVGGNSPPRLDGEVLSRRRFLAYLFGYLSFAAFALIGLSVIAGLLEPLVLSWKIARFAKAANCLAAGLVGGWLTQAMIATLLGLYYFTERLQISDRRVQFGPSRDAPPDRG
jgi:hypothetical protein